MHCFLLVVAVMQILQNAAIKGSSRSLFATFLASAAAPILLGFLTTVFTFRRYVPLFIAYFAFAFVVVGDVSMAVMSSLFFFYFFLSFAPSSFTLAECMLLTQVFTLPVFAVEAIERGWVSNVGEQHFVVAYLCSGALLCCAATTAVVSVVGRETKSEKTIGFVLSVCAWLAVIAAITVRVSYNLEGGVDPFSWAIAFLVGKTRRQWISGIWLTALFVTVAVANRVNGTVPQTIYRKIFHALAVALFLPGILIDIDFLAVSLAIASVIMLYVEMLRLLDAPLLGKVIHSYVSSNTDEKDAGPLVLTHFYLLLGTSLPVWYVWVRRDSIETSTVAFLISICGIITVGVQDAAASTFGKLYGKHKWMGGSKKSVEGTAAGIIAALLSTLLFMLVRDVVMHADTLLTLPPLSAFFAFILAGIVEAVSDQIDNLILPLVALNVIAISGG